MLDELSLLISYVNNPEADRKEYLRAIEEDNCQDNCLGKQSGSARKLTAKHLVELYVLDPSITLFKSLLYFWCREPNGRPILALLFAYTRDAILRMSAPFILRFPEGTVVKREALEEFIDSHDPGRYSAATLRSTAQNLNSTWTKAGHLVGRRTKIRSKADPTPATVSFALLLGYLAGIRGEALFETEYAKILDCSISRALELAEMASLRGWIVFKRVGKIMEVLFPNLLTSQEMEWIREQS